MDSSKVMSELTIKTDLFVRSQPQSGLTLLLL